MARINDPRVVQIYGAARQGDCCYIAMEYVPGRSAEALLAEGGRLRPEQATDILVQAASALVAAHRSGVVHRDVKPGNLLMGPGGVTKLSDFGMALGAAGSRAGQPQARAGTPFYTAPEIWRGAVASPASDLYSLGATYFHLLTGRPPFPAAELAAVERAHLTAPAPDPREVVPALPPSCAALVLRALAKAPGERHPSAQELVWEGRRVLQELAGHARPGGTSGSGRTLDPSGSGRTLGSTGTTPAGGTPIGALAGFRSQPGAGRAVPEAAGSVARSGGALGAAAPAPAPELAAAPVPRALAPLGFTRRPFGAVSPESPPYQAEPFASAGRRLAEALADPAAGVVLLTAPRGAGATTLLRRVVAEARRTRLVLALDVREEHEGRTLPQRLAALAGVSEANPAVPDPAEALLVWLADERRLRRQAPLVVLDGADLPHPATTGLAPLLTGALATRAAAVLVAGAPGLAAALGRAGVTFRDRPPVEVALPPLDAGQVGGWLRAWLGATRPAGAPPLVLSPDFLLLLARRSGGVLSRLEVLAENALLLAAAGGRRTLTSWHAWAAPEGERWADQEAPALPGRPAGWPSGEAAAAIDEARGAAGLAPFPRGGRP